MSSQAQKVPSTPLKSILNFRDVGRTVNILLSSTLLNPGLVYRSARPDEASSQDRISLSETYNIRSIIDLRSTTEHHNQANKRNAKASTSITTPHTETTTVKAIEIDGFRHHAINLNGGAFARGLLWRLSWLNLARVVSYMAIGYRNEAIRVLAEEVMVPRGLIGLGIDSLDYGTTELRAIFAIFADAGNYPILVHCTQGKDRTGLVILLLLLLCEVPSGIINADYMASERELRSEREERVKEMKNAGFTEDFADCSSGWVEGVVGHIDDVYGGVESYLRRIGVDDEMQAGIRNILMKQS